MLSILLIQLEQHSADLSPHMASSLEHIHLIMIIATLACLTTLILALIAQEINLIFEGLASNIDCRSKLITSSCHYAQVLI